MKNVKYDKFVVGINGFAVGVMTEYILKTPDPNIPLGVVCLCFSLAITVAYIFKD